jgi:molecular chaperone DnaK
MRSYCEPRKTQVFVTNQTSLDIRILEGERASIHEIGTFHFVDLSLPNQIEVAMEIDFNGVLHITATEQNTGTVQKMSIAAANERLGCEKFEQMIEDATMESD